MNYKGAFWGLALFSIDFWIYWILLIVLDDVFQTGTIMFLFLGILMFLMIFSYCKVMKSLKKDQSDSEFSFVFFSLFLVGAIASLFFLGSSFFTDWYRSRYHDSATIPGLQFGFYYIMWCITFVILFICRCIGKKIAENKEQSD